LGRHLRGGLALRGQSGPHSKDVLSVIARLMTLETIVADLARRLSDR